MRKIQGRLGWVLMALFIALPACDDTQTPTEPPPPPETQPPGAPVTGQVTIYQNAGFGGQGYTLRGSVFDLSDLLGPCNAPGNEANDGNWEDCISSVELVGGYTAILYEKDGYEGEALPVLTSISDLDNIPGCDAGDWDNCASSIQVFPPSEANR